MKHLRQISACRAKAPRVDPVHSSAPASGFSLVELLVVVVLILVLTTLYWNHGAGGNRRARACESNLQKIHLALQIYAADFTRRYPSLPDPGTSGRVLSLLVPRYTADTATFLCPAGNDRALPAGEPFGNRHISYAYYMGQPPDRATAPLLSDRQVDARAKQEHDLVFSESGKPPGNNHGRQGGNILFSDGHVQWSPPRLAFPLVTSPSAVLLNP